MNNRPYIWQMIKEAVESKDGNSTYSEIKEYIRKNYGDVNESTINCQIIVCTVNQPSRIYYPENYKARIADSRYDFLFSLGRGQVTLYDPTKHGIWEIRKNDYGKLIVAQKDVDDLSTSADSIADSSEEEILAFPFESHLRDFIAKNIESIIVNSHRLKLYTDPQERNGIEYPTDVGPIDILAVDEENNLVVFELKLSKGEDRTVGQILRYMGWVKRNLADNRKVQGVIVAEKMSEQLKYAVSMISNISLFEYEISFKISQVSL